MRTPKKQATGSIFAKNRDKMRHLFTTEGDRLAVLTGECAGIYYDFSKCPVSLSELEAMASPHLWGRFKAWREDLMQSKIVNRSEKQAATHICERSSGTDEKVAESKLLREKAFALANQIRSGEFGQIDSLLHLGIGGSALGPKLLLDALGRDSMFNVKIVSNVDGSALKQALESLDPSRTMIAIASKTFTTTETLLNARSSLKWLEESGIDAPLDRCVALTASFEEARRFGIKQEQILSFCRTVGGRYSLWSSIGFPAMLSLGSDEFSLLLKGAKSTDDHFFGKDRLENIPFLSALIDSVYRLSGISTRAVFAYDDRLKYLPPYLQQLEMESNGKSVTNEGNPTQNLTSPIVWGGTGTDAQHAVFQLLHQGTHMIPSEFVAVIDPGHGLDAEHHRQLLANCFAQGAALLAGRSCVDGHDARNFEGGRPSSTILLKQLNVETLGALISFYEHRAFANAFLMGVNPFDQWGVELGKEMARDVASGNFKHLDQSTLTLLERSDLHYS